MAAKIYAKGYSSKQLNHLKPGDWFYKAETPLTDYVYCVVDARHLPDTLEAETELTEGGSCLVFDPQDGTLKVIGGGHLVFLLDVTITHNKASV